MGCISSSEEQVIAQTGMQAVGGGGDYLEDRILDMIGDGNDLKQRI